MKKAYNVYSILEKTVSKVAMLTSVFALCFLFSGQVYSQASPPDAIFSNDQMADIMSTVRVNHDRLNPASTEPEAALLIARALWEEHKATLDLTADVNAEIDYEVKNVFLRRFVGALKKGDAFEKSFIHGRTDAELQFSSYGPGVYTGVNTVSVLANEILGKFF